jgi:hypothetical protein
VLVGEELVVVEVKNKKGKEGAISRYQRGCEVRGFSAISEALGEAHLSCLQPKWLTPGWDDTSRVLAMVTPCLQWP